MAELRYDDRVALVTGAGRGLGAAYAKLLAARGAKIVVNDLPQDDSAPEPNSVKSVVEEICAAGGEAVGDFHSVTEPDGGEAMVGLALETFGRIDIVIHNAGTALGDLHHHWSVHVDGGRRVVKAAWDHLIEQRYGRVILTTSGVGLYGRQGPDGANDFGDDELYGLAKLAEAGLARHLALRGSSSNVLVNSISPVALTQSLTDSMPSWKPTPRLEWLQTCTVDQVAPVVAWLAHESCDVSGEILRAAGGRIARTFFAETPGWWSEQPTPEDVADHLEEIMAEGGYHVPVSADDIPFELGRIRAAGLI